MTPSLLKQVQAHSISDNSAMNLFDGKNKKVYTQPLFIEIRISIELQFNTQKIVKLYSITSCARH